MRILSYWFALVLALTAINCASLSTFNEKLLAGYSTVTTIRINAGLLLQAKKITPDDAENVQAQCDIARSSLDIARALAATDQVAAGDKLGATVTVLTALQNYLRARSQ